MQSTDQGVLLPDVEIKPFIYVSFELIGIVISSMQIKHSNYLRVDIKKILVLQDYIYIKCLSGIASCWWAEATMATVSGAI